MPALPAYRAPLGPRASRPHRVCTTKHRGSSQRNGFPSFAYVYSMWWLLRRPQLTVLCVLCASNLFHGRRLPGRSL